MLRKILFSLMFFLLFSTFAYADDPNSPAGNWQTISEKTKQPSSIVKISIENNALVGQVLRLLPGSRYKVTDLCTQCPADSKNKPIVGLKFLWDFVPDQKENATWRDGKVLDPNDGNIYKGSIKITENGKKMVLRGYWGPFWRTQTWTRV